MAFRFTVVADGSSDAALVPIVEWVLTRVPNVATLGFTVKFTLGATGARNRPALAGKIERAVREFPADLLFVHRDAERDDPELRHAEIADAARVAGIAPPIAVVPVRMTEAWLLCDQAALRRAADNPNGACRLDLPPIKRLETLPDPKQECNQLLVTASEKSGRRLAQFNRPSELASRRRRLASLIETFEPLMELEAFRRFYEGAVAACERLGPLGTAIASDL